MSLYLPQILMHGFLSILLSMCGCNFVSNKAIQGSGVAKTETRDLPAFTRIESAGSAEITVRIGDKQSFTIEADDNILPLIDTNVRGDKLIVSSHESYSTRTPIKIAITVAALNEARIGGSGNINATGIAAQQFDAHISGSGDIILTGQAETLKASISGSGKIDTTRMPAAKADVRVTGSGDMRINATNSISAQITGSGDIRYTGNPSDVQQQITGSGSVTKM